jgi:hypothetical protein
MKSILLISFFLITTHFLSSGQEKLLERFNWLKGEWVGEGSGQPGQGQGSFTFRFDLDKNILIRESHTEFPVSSDRPASLHDDIMVIYPVDKNASVKAIYFDNEKHIINYSLSFSDKSIVFTSEKTENVPIFRLSYTPLEEGKLNTLFEMSQDGEHFIKYIEGKSIRKK